MPRSTLLDYREVLIQRIAEAQQKLQEVNWDLTYRHAQSVGVLPTPNGKMPSQTPDVEQA